jgi:hypothetical protein
MGVDSMVVLDTRADAADYPAMVDECRASGKDLELHRDCVPVWATKT